MNETILDEQILQSLSNYDQKPPTVAGLAYHLGMTISELMLHIKRQDEIGRALRYQLTYISSWYEQRINQSSIVYLRYIHNLMNVDFDERSYLDRTYE